MKQLTASSVIQRPASSLPPAVARAYVSRYAHQAVEIGTVMQECEWSREARLASALIVAGETARRSQKISRERFLELAAAVYDGVEYLSGSEADPLAAYNDDDGL